MLETTSYSRFGGQGAVLIERNDTLKRQVTAWFRGQVVLGGNKSYF
jgi:hypothetical protein